MTLLWLVGVGAATMHVGQTPAPRVAKAVPAPAPGPSIISQAKLKMSVLYDPLLPAHPAQLKLNETPPQCRGCGGKQFGPTRRFPYGAGVPRYRRAAANCSCAGP